MAISAAVFVGGIGPWRDALTAKAKSLKVGPTGVTAHASWSTRSFRRGSAPHPGGPASGPCMSARGTRVLEITPSTRHSPVQVNAGHEEGADVGPLISPAAKQRVEGLIQSAVDEVRLPCMLLRLL
jgi:hypothetical protein